MAESPSCAFCQTEVESIEHLLFSGRVSSSFWKHVLSWLRDYNISVDNLKEEDVIFGKFDIAEDFLLFLKPYFASGQVLYLLSEIPEWYTFSSRFYSQDKAYLQHRTPYCQKKRQIKQSF